MDPSGRLPARTREGKSTPKRVQRRSGSARWSSPVEIPKQAIFLIHEGVQKSRPEGICTRIHADLFGQGAARPRLFASSESRCKIEPSAGTTVLASAYRYEAPGLLGLPPLIGCWNRPDNVIWIMPPGDTGCGLWRWFTSGGDDRADERSQNGSSSTRSVFLIVRYLPPKHPDRPPSTPAQALEILSKPDVEFYLRPTARLCSTPPIRTTVLIDLVVRRARMGNVGGSADSSFGRQSTRSNCWYCRWSQSFSCKT